MQKDVNSVGYTPPWYTQKWCYLSTSIILFIIKSNILDLDGVFVCFFLSLFTLWLLSTNDDVHKRSEYMKKTYIKMLKWNMITVWINNTKEIFANAMEVPGEWWPFLDIQVQRARCMTITSWELYNNFSNIFYVYLQCLMESCQNEKESKFINFSEAFWAVKTIYHFHKCNQQTRHTKYG